MTILNYEDFYVKDGNLYKKLNKEFIVVNGEVYFRTSRTTQIGYRTVCSNTVVKEIELDRPDRVLHEKDPDHIRY